MYSVTKQYDKCHSSILFLCFPYFLDYNKIRQYERKERQRPVWTMKNAVNCGMIILLCMFSLFFVQPDLPYVLAFLCALILCSTDLFLEEDRIYAAVCFIYFSAAVFMPVFRYFYPAVCFGLFRRKFYVPAAISTALYLILDLIFLPGEPILSCLELFGFAVCFLLASTARDRDSLQDTLRRTMDDSTERDLLLTEKNRTLLEKQDYEIYTATLQERNRIAREIHDNVGHLLSRSILLAGAAKTVNRNEVLSPTLDSLDQTLNAAMDNIRASVHDLRDEAVNLEEAVRSLIDDFTFCPVTYCYDAGRLIPKDVKYSFISITKEALSNIMRHSNARKASVTIREHPALYQLCIEDDGTLINNVSGLAGNSMGMGLANMKERAAKLNGTIHITSGNGFRILVTIPKRRESYETDTDRR